LHTNVALARIRAHGSESMRTPILSLDATSWSIACMEADELAVGMITYQRSRRRFRTVSATHQSFSCRAWPTFAPIGG
jgi:hypothetical protein